MTRLARQIRPLESDSVPRRHVVFDTEARQRRRPGYVEQTWQLGHADYLDLARRREPQLVASTPYTDPAAFWGDVQAFTRANARTVCWAHNLSYDLRISRALELLPAAGWRLQGIVLERTASWASFGRDGATILCCDLLAWLPTSLARIATDLGHSQAELDHATATDAQLAERCRGDVEITRLALLELLELIEGEQLGPFRPTAAGQSHAAWRRRFMHHQVIAHDQPDLLEIERRAMWTGRCEAWAWGKIEREGIAEYDLRLAYCNIAARESVPVSLVGSTGPFDYLRFLQLQRSYGVLADVEIETDVPTVPAGDGDFIHWPVGTIETVLWAPELELAYKTAKRVTVRRAWLYKREPALSEFANWVLGQLDNPPAGRTAVQSRLLKHWSRTLVGRMALRYRRWEQFGRLDHSDLQLGVMLDLDTGVATDALTVGLEMMTLAELAEADTSLPQITGWIMAEARARLWRLVGIAGVHNVLYMDTDALIVTAQGAARLDVAISHRGAWSLTRKGTYRSLTIHGPRNLEVGQGRRVAGVPSGARRTGPGEYDGEVWRSVKESMTLGELDRVVVSRRTFRVKATDRRRDHLANGATAPHVIGGSNA